MSIRKWLGIAFIAVLVWPGLGYAGQYDLKEVTPEIQKALSNRQNRYSQLKAMKAQGLLGETHHGYLHVLETSPEASALAEAENQDRGVIYRAILRQNQLVEHPQGLADIEMAFGAVQREKATPGEHVQLPDGQWVAKA